MDLIVLGSAAAIGVALGATGGGGALLAVPLFVNVMHFEPRTAIAMTLPIVGLTSLIGAIGHTVAGHIHLRPAIVFGTIAMTGAYIGARLSALVTGPTQIAVLSIVMLLASASLWMRSSPPALPAPPAPPAPTRPILLTLVALGLGVLTGFVGVGGGFLFAPALVLLAGMPLAHAAGTSLVVIAMNAAAGFAGYAGEVAVPWQTVAEFVAVAGTFSLAGLALVRIVPQHIFQRAFAVFLVIMGASLLYQHLS